MLRMFGTMPQARTRTRTSPARGSGTSICSMRNGVPGSYSSAARILAIERRQSVAIEFAHCDVHAGCAFERGNKGFEPFSRNDREHAIVVGKKDEEGNHLFPVHGTLEPNQIAIAIAERILKRKHWPDVENGLNAIREIESRLSNAPDLLARTRATLQTMGRMERHRGHFYNWYDTASLAPLLPMVVSTVDSGNLAGHLFTLAAGLEQLAERPAVSSRALDGIADTLDIVDELAEHAAAPLREAIAAMRRQLSPAQCRNADTLPGLQDCLARGFNRTGFFEVDTGEQKNWTVQLTDRSQVPQAAPKTSLNQNQLKSGMGGR